MQQPGLCFTHCISSHMFRHQSELKKDKKGGYMEARVSLGKNCPDSCNISISLVSQVGTNNNK